MANYANRSSKCDAKGKGKVGASGPPPAPILIPVPISVSSAGMVVSATAPAGIAASSGGVPLARKSVPPSSGTKVAPVPPKRRRLTKHGKFLFFIDTL
jgi:hypothetical protein